MKWFVVRSHWRLVANAAPGAPKPPFDLLVTKLHLAQADALYEAEQKVRARAARSRAAFRNVYGASVKAHLLGYRETFQVMDGLVEFGSISTEWRIVSRGVADEKIPWVTAANVTHTRMLKHLDHFVPAKDLRLHDKRTRQGSSARDWVSYPAIGELRPRPDGPTRPILGKRSKG